ncbi:MAG: intein-containing RctB family protein [Candidatus Brockarchaeota archaeon]|nr:intein-containing RctB family protein [Candidatus Brockarchaeota archaeon]
MGAKRGMRVPLKIFANETLLQKMTQDKTVEQGLNVATLPGIYKSSIILPDGHEGYGFPIGGVGAFDVKDGVVSPGGVGYDINCLSGDSLILHEHGYRLPIKEFLKSWNRERVMCASLEKGVKPTEIMRFIKIRPNRRVFRVETESGMKIIATEDHPFLTRRGMVPLSEIGYEDVAVYPFEGVLYESAEPITIVSEEDIKRLKIPGRKELVISELKKRGLLPLRSNNSKFPYLLKLMGFILGDGVLLYTGKSHAAWFFAGAEDLEDIRSDILRIGFKPSKIYSRARRHKVETKYDKYDFSTIEHSIKVCSRSLISLMVAMGVPLGNKASQNYELPEWLFRLPLWQKRLFLAAFFGAELSKPKTVTGHPFKFYMPILSQDKKKGHEEAGVKLLKQIALLLREFGVEVKKITIEPEAVKGKQGVSTRLRLIISGSPKNLVKLWSKVGFEYNREKKHLANVAVHYLKLKMRVIKAREKVQQVAIAMKDGGSSNVTIYETLESEHVNRRFIERSLYEGRKSLPRAPLSLPPFEDFLESATKGLGKTGVVWDRVVKREELLFNEDVYDFTVKEDVHNFIANGFVVSNCGVRLLLTNLNVDNVKPVLRELLDEIFHNVPSGLGSEGKLRMSFDELDSAVREGVDWAIKRGYGWKEDAEFIEENGCLRGADPSRVSVTAKRRGLPQLGSLGSGNHFLEIDYVERIIDGEVARGFGIERTGQIVVLIHTGSRGYGHQVCSDYLKTMEAASRKYNIWLPDRELAAVPVESHEARDYFAAMACAVNYAFLNRQVITHWVRESFAKVFKKDASEFGLNILYDVAHNIAKIEDHRVNGEKKRVVVHRKGATRSFPPGSSHIPSKYREYGQPVLIPGSMGSASWVLVGTETAMEASFGSTAHGAGRMLSRHEAMRRFTSRQIRGMLEERGVYLRVADMNLVAEEAPGAYKDPDEVVEVTDRAGISRKVARLVPLGVVKG